MLGKFVVILVLLLQTFIQPVAPEVSPKNQELEESEETIDCSSCLFTEEEEEEEEPGLNCSLVLVSSHCQYCNTSTQCPRGLCRHITKPAGPLVPDNVLGLCHQSSSLRTVFPKDPLGRIISFGLLGIVLSVLSFIFLRLFVSACSWRKCCVCQCSVSVQCCCEPKLPRLRVIPATGDRRLARDELDPTPPPSYLDIYPVTTQQFSQFNLTLPDQTEPSLLTPITATSLDEERPPPLTPPPTSRQLSLPVAGEEGEEVPGLEDQDPQYLDSAEFDWGSVASFPPQHQQDTEAADIFTIYNSRLRVISVRPTTC